ncbi:MAG: hypothetical protein ACREKK_10825 [Candidatus Methylomirabilales bacterium]
MRLNFVSPPLAEIDGNVARLATAITGPGTPCTVQGAGVELSPGLC